MCLASRHIDRVGITVRIRVRHNHRRDRRGNRRRHQRAASSGISRYLRRDRGGLCDTLCLHVRLGLRALRCSPRLDDLRIRRRAGGQTRRGEVCGAQAVERIQNTRSIDARCQQARLRARRHGTELVEAETSAYKGTPFRRQRELGVRAAKERTVKALGCVAEAASYQVAGWTADGFRAVWKTLLACAGRHVVEVDGVIGVWHGTQEEARRIRGESTVLEGRIADA